MTLSYKRAVPEDLDLLVETRIEVLRAANLLDSSVEMPEVAAQARAYYRRALADGSHIAYMVFDGPRLAGTGGVSFFQVLPTYHNPTGRKAYIMNMYTRPAYRRRGIAGTVLDLLVSAAKEAGIAAISLEATDMGRPLYERYGFVGMEHEMELPEQRSPAESPKE